MTPSESVDISKPVAVPVKDGEESDAAGHVSRTRAVVRRFRANRSAVVGGVLLLLIIIVTAAAPLIAPYGPTQVDISDRLSGPTAEHWLGTDSLGRDTLTRLMHGGRVSLAAAGLAVLIATAIGLPLGLISGYFGGVVDWFLDRAADVLMSFPAIVLTIAIIAAVGPGLTTAMVSLGIVYAPRMYRVVRGSTIEVRREVYIEASTSIGTPSLVILRKRVLPNILPATLVQLSFLLASALLAEVTVSLLGLGALPPTASWGSMLGQAFQEMRSQPWLAVYPGIAIAIATLCFNLVGDGLRDAFGRETRKAS
ncbi:peptide/nickel transport system permease protein [Actinomadura pelletieri DSM 43383]|uniref:Peptide/nickel transport system permease protein n=1 Tax=Actinomadura pelletieri DSM 43383 TaxID=1120940 RepID=A0A495QGA9_9ACTN|nr:ABC transporter permease [Actinomadura pelletieri]RKS70899.1 peptide/nickel transport system permease protein [Actinomadura pelletieri DSM 43383]